MPLSPAELAALRQEYSMRPLRRADLAPDPVVQFHEWLRAAQESGLLEPNAMVLSTSGAGGQPWSRTVLLKGLDARGFVFFTNYEGAKARQLSAHPPCALTFWWGALERQVNVTGMAERTSGEENEAYFRSRPVSSQLGAWASQQSERVADRAELEQKFADARARFGEEEIPLPPFWGGFRVRPATIEFWQGQRSRLHDRLRYTRTPDDSWSIERLSP